MKTPVVTSLGKVEVDEEGGSETPRARVQVLEAASSDAVDCEVVVGTIKVVRVVHLAWHALRRRVGGDGEVRVFHSSA